MNVDTINVSHIHLALTMHTRTMTMNTINANGLTFAYLEEGHGPLVLMLHGFPDTAHTWSHQMASLAAAGYRVIAPFLRGYPPTDIPHNGYYDKATLVRDVAALIGALSEGEPVYLVSQDWGAITAYGVVAAYPELVRRAVVMAVPHPAEVNKSLLLPKHVQRSFHWWFFQLPNLPEKALPENDLPSLTISGTTGPHQATVMKRILQASRTCSNNPVHLRQRWAITVPCLMFKRWTHVLTMYAARWSEQYRRQRWRCAAPTTYALN